MFQDNRPVDLTAFSRRIKELQMDSGMGVAEYASHVGVSYQTWSKWVNGWTTPSAANLARISRKSDVSIDYLIGASDSREEEWEDEAETEVDPIAESLAAAVGPPREVQQPPIALNNDAALGAAIADAIGPGTRVIVNGGEYGGEAA